MDEHEVTEEQKTRRQKCVDWFKGPTPFLCSVYFIAQWGDWLWVFASGIYLITIDNGILLLAGLMGFFSGTCVLLFGGIIGKWVDRNTRLHVIRVSLILVNASLLLSSALVFLALYLLSDKPDLWYGAFGYVVEILLLCFSVLSQLFNMAYRISLDRDWLVVVAGDDTAKLANLNAVTRALDMAAKILSPLCMGALMTIMSLKMSALFICCWNFASFFVEYFLLLQVYKRTPQLMVKNNTNISHSEDADKSSLRGSSISADERCETSEDNEDRENHSSNSRFLRRICSPLITLINSWRTYFKQRIFFAGLGFSMLYMTVLSFDSVTTGYIYRNGVSESMAGMLMSLAGAMGFISPLIYPFIRRAIGLEFTGILAFSLEVFCLTLAVISIWMPGSLFDIHFNSKPKVASENCTVLFNVTSELTTDDLENMTSANVTGKSCENGMEEPSTSIILFLVGVILSRTGLWLADLSVTQVMQENIIEVERGVVNGVQNSLNKVLEMVKYILVMVAPNVETYGILIILTFLFILSGDLLFSYYVYQVKRGKYRYSHELEAKERETSKNYSSLENFSEKDAFSEKE